MGSCKEQIGNDRRIVTAPWKWIKRQTSKWRRRRERVDPEGAPRRTPYRGWVA